MKKISILLLLLTIYQINIIYCDARDVHDSEKEEQSNGK